ncbi:MAG: PDZ domain-containing protein [Clostridia bacterium]|nr:PDZ domain-containing protein [Clostridia bacterium]
MLSFPIGQVFSIIVASMVSILSYAPTMIAFWVVLFVVYSQYRRVCTLEEQTLRRSRGSALVRTMFALGQGIVGGLVGSFVFILLGASIDQMGLEFIWMIALALALFDMRLICFAYAGGIVALSSLAFGWPKVDIPAVMSLVGVLHLVEAGLIWSTGAQDAIPVFAADRDGRPMGGFMMQKYWPLPMAIGYLLYLPFANLPVDMLKMPDWWPLIRSSVLPPLGAEAVYLVLAITAVAGYGDVTYTRTPERKTTETAATSAAFSLALLGLAILSGKYPALQWAAALFSPIGHELIIYLARRTEMEGSPIFQSGPSGLMILDVMPGSPAQAAGVRSGDVIEAVNCQPVAAIGEFIEAISVVPHTVILDLRSPSPGGPPAQKTVQIRRASAGIGVVLVPREGSFQALQFEKTGLIALLIRFIRVRGRTRRL